MKRVSVIRALIAAGALWCAPAGAADLPAPKELPAEAKAPDPLIGFSFFSRYATDYNFRGVSQSNLQGSYQTYFEANFFNNFFYTAMATLQTRLPTQPAFEFDLMAGIRPTWDKFTFDLGILYYFYPNETRLFGFDAANNPFPITQANSDFYEGAAKVLYQATDSLVLGANVYHSPNFFGTHAIGTYASGTAAYTLPATLFSFLPEAYASGFSISGELGYFTLGAAKTSATGPFNPATGRFPSLNLASYLYGNVGVSYAYKNLLLDVRYHDTSLTPSECFNFTGDYRGFLNGGTSRWCGSAFIGSITWQASTAAPGIYAEPGGLLDLFK
ncbi:TorF family putative porin [Methylorubrum zatmanii]